MAVTTQYVVTHKGAEKLVTTDKKDADKYDKMLEVADSLCAYVEAKGIKLDEDTAESLSIMLSKNKESVMRLFKGIDTQTVLQGEEENVVELDMQKAS